MKLRLSRYDPEMLLAISRQTISSIVANALLRAVVFTILLQAISLASVGQWTSLLQFTVLTITFAFIIFSIDIFERAWAIYALNKD